jgi:hypothetical protein
MRKVWLDDEKTVLILTEKLNMLLKVIIQLSMIMKRPSGQIMYYTVSLEWIKWYVTATFLYWILYIESAHK